MSWETIVAVVTHPIVIMTVTAVAGVAIKGFVKYKGAFEALVDIPRAVLKARGHKSDGGETITMDEYAEIGKKIVKFVGEAGPLVKGNK